MSVPSAVAWAGDHVVLLDQLLLPNEVSFRNCRTWQEVAEGIRTMVVRGAPAIGIAGAMGVALGAWQHRNLGWDSFRFAMEEVLRGMASARPTAVNLPWAVNRMKGVLSLHMTSSAAVEALIAEAKAILEEDICANHRIGEFGAALIPERATVVTYCNAGALAVSAWGTALGVIRSAHAQGKIERVIVPETRPYLQGARLTAWELLQDGLPVTLLCDNMIGAFMRTKGVHCAVVGADRIAANGDTANKIGTYALAVLCKHHGIPLYIAAPLSTLDLTLASGAAIPIEERPEQELTTIRGQRIAPEGVQVWNPSFDVTPADLIAGIITPAGVARAPYLESLAALQ